MNWTIAILAAGIVVNLINDGGVVLEPSVMNEVEHALARAKPPAEVRQIEGDVFATNGLSATAIAIKLVSMQGSDGAWTVRGTNVTAEAVAILSQVSGIAVSGENSIISKESERKDKR